MTQGGSPHEIATELLARLAVGRTSSEAVNNYRRGMQRLVSCVTNSVVDVAGGYYPSPGPHTLAMNGGHPAALGGPSRLMLRLQQNP